MKRIYLVLCLTLLSCSLADQAMDHFSSVRSLETTDADSLYHQSLLPTIDAGGVDPIYVAPFCTILGEENTQIEDYGNRFILSWGWKAQTEQQARDYLENALVKVTVNGEAVSDAERSEIYEEEETFHVFWEKSLGVLDRGAYTMTFFAKFRNAIFDGSDYFGPGTENESMEDTCYLIVE